MLSARNPRVQELRRLVRQRKIRDEAGLFVVEGAGLLAEALANGHAPIDVFIEDGERLPPSLDGALDRSKTSVWELGPEVLASVASTASPQPLLATMPFMATDLDDALHERRSFVVVGAGVNDPGNAGGIVRTAAAAGADAVIFCDESADIYNPKVVRASAGALFRVPVVRDGGTDAVFDTLSQRGFRCVGLAGDVETSYLDIDYSHKTALVLGNEAHGLSAAIRTRLDSQVRIPMAAGVESLNVGAAAAVVCFEVGRQRR